MYGPRVNRVGKGERYRMSKSEALFKEAVQVIPGGVNSPVRAFGSIGLPPFLLKVPRALTFMMRMAIRISII